MRKKIFPLLLTLLLICCQSATESVNTYGYTVPDTTPVIFAPDVISIKGRLEHGISFTPDTKEVAFGILDTNDFSGIIYHAKKHSNTWSKPTVFEPLQGESVFLPYFTPDGTSLLYAKNKTTANNYITDIWTLDKDQNIWANPKKLKMPISSLAREASACMTLDRTLYVSSNRGENGLADIYTSSPNDTAYTNIERIDAISSERDEESIFIAPDERYLIFSRFTTTTNSPDLFISYQDSDKNWTSPSVLDIPITTLLWERRPFVSIDNKFLFYTKMTFKESAMIESDIYWVNTQQVFKPFVYRPIPEKTIKVGAETTIASPADYFKDIDNEKLDLLFESKNVDWATFDREKRILVMHPTEIGAFEFTFTAIDAYSNKTSDTLKITVEE